MPTVLRFAQGRQIAKKHGRTPQAFAAAFCRSAASSMPVGFGHIYRRARTALYNL